MRPGVSNVVCCHNSVSRLGATLRHLSEQLVQSDVPWEVIVVDNCSSDETASYAKRIWPAHLARRFRVVNESNPGLTSARQRGFDEASHEIVSFIDDDNWVCRDWTELVSEIMEAKPDAGALGGFCEAEFEAEPPEWFERFSRSYAVGGMATEASDVTWSKGYLFGAGLSIRKRAWQSIRRHGFTPLLSDRTGTALTSGGDTEMCRALRLAGWKLYYDPRLRLKHYMPAARLDWNYLRRLRRSMGSASIFTDSYTFASRPNRFGISKPIKENWVFQIMTTLFELAHCGAMAVRPRLRNREGDEKALEVEGRIGRLQALWHARFDYDRTIRKVRSAPWRSARTDQIRLVKPTLARLEH